MSVAADQLRTTRTLAMSATALLSVALLWSVDSAASTGTAASRHVRPAVSPSRFRPARSAGTVFPSLAAVDAISGSTARRVIGPGRRRSRGVPAVESDHGYSRSSSSRSFSVDGKAAAAAAAVVIVIRPKGPSRGRAATADNDRALAFPCDRPSTSTCGPPTTDRSSRSPFSLIPHDWPSSAVDEFRNWLADVLQPSTVPRRGTTNECGPAATVPSTSTWPTICRTTTYRTTCRTTCRTTRRTTTEEECRPTTVQRAPEHSSTAQSTTENWLERMRTFCVPTGTTATASGCDTDDGGTARYDRPSTAENWVERLRTFRREPPLPGTAESTGAGRGKSTECGRTTCDYADDGGGWTVAGESRSGAATTERQASSQYTTERGSRWLSIGLRKIAPTAAARRRAAAAHERTPWSRSSRRRSVATTDPPIVCVLRNTRGALAVRAKIVPRPRDRKTNVRT